jgi:hypothetical protein
MLEDQLLIIQNWHMVEESYDHGGMVVSFLDKPPITIDNMTEQKFLSCYVDGKSFCYTHIESFVNDFAHLLNNVRHILIDKYDCQKKRKSLSCSRHAMSDCVKKPRKM